MELVRHVSFVDCPGHDILMATMLNGAAVMDGAMLLIAANEPCPQPQTSEHLAAVEIMRLQHIIILQNKVDLVTEAAALNQHETIQRFIQVRARAGRLAGRLAGRPWAGRARTRRQHRPLRIQPPLTGVPLLPPRSCPARRARLQRARQWCPSRRSSSTTWTLCASTL